MGFWTLFEVASMPILQVLLISVLGALMATDYLKLLPSDARKSLNKIVFVVFTPSLMFASLAKTVTLDDIISWWFMPINIGLTFLVGGILGWIVVKILKPEVHLEGLIVATCSAGNLGNLLLIVIPAICKEDGSPFGDHGICSSVGLSYASFSMAVGGFYIWTYTYHLIRSSSVKFRAMKAAEEDALKKPNNDLLNANEKSHLLQDDDLAVTNIQDPENQAIIHPSIKKGEVSSWSKIAGTLNKIVEELLAPPTVAAIIGLIFGSVTWLKNLIIGSNAPLRVIQDSVKLLGDGTIPCITLILGGNLTQGLRKAKVKPMIIIAVVCVRYIFSPLVGILVLKAAGKLGFLAGDPLYKFVLMIQYTLPPAMNIGTMTQLFDVAQEECSVLFLWTYLVAAFALTIWSTIFMWLLS
ncbi:protein PIN-LIKES 5-like [Lycium barbarum]|uniref:protein PIN-LIKES 5-like n=1 Tax=Lycium barbarum TaxID=112863 RepID=UPI00293E0928|nr:protein PIN-LIKES 5-like [Lycium barbarum]XP_060190266.1 protein PIN-LIKES 5-like [Lycium barbarum]XP_060190267.1 protein PIN-LIKES 5-like [Lycium barbarum]XP_060190268.1 protein PIN-LIKES 5-like [Lycium barbarum]